LRLLPILLDKLGNEHRGIVNGSDLLALRTPNLSSDMLIRHLSEKTAFSATQ